MATDFISRSEFERKMQERYCFNCERKGNHPIFGVACKACWVLDMLDEVEQFQSADVVEVVRGRWIEVSRPTQNKKAAICECSVCGDAIWVYDGQREWKYCPNCGAKMDGGVNDATD